MRQATLLFLQQDNQVLLAMKKRGFGEGHWNGVGGKIEPQETAGVAAIRECKEEIGVIPKVLKSAGTLHFSFPSDESSPMNMTVHLFTCHDWTGTPKETEEMAPRWFATTRIPFDKMWEDDTFWLPQVLSGKIIDGSFVFNAANHLEAHTVTEIHEVQLT